MQGQKEGIKTSKLARQPDSPLDKIGRSGWRRKMYILLQAKWGANRGGASYSHRCTLPPKVVRTLKVVRTANTFGKQKGKQLPPAFLHSAETLKWCNPYYRSILIVTSYYHYDSSITSYYHYDSPYYYSDSNKSW